MLTAKVAVATCCALFLGIVCATKAQAQLQAPYVEYAAKFTCGQETPNEIDDVVTGVYGSSINIHNPQAAVTINFVKKIVVANREGSDFLPPFVTKAVLRPDQADRVDCSFIWRALKRKPMTYVEGFIVLEVPRQGATHPVQPLLDVVGKYTARPINGGVSTQSVVQIEGKAITD